VLHAAASDVQFELALAAAQEMRPVIDCTFTQDKIVEAHRYSIPAASAATFA
jgi:hypothetical protein